MQHLPIHPVTGLRALAIIRGRVIFPVIGGEGDNPPPSADINTLTQQIADLKKQNDQLTGKITDLETAKGQVDKDKQSQQDLLDKIAKIFDPEKGKLDPEQLSKTITERDSALAEKDKAIAERDKQLQDMITAGKVRDLAGESASALLDSVSFNSRLGSLDPKDSDFDKKLKALVEEFKPKIAQRSGGADHSGGTNGTDHKYTREELQAMMKKGKVAEVNKLRAEGKLNHLMGVK